MKNKVLVTGSNGQLGKEISDYVKRSNLKKEYEFIFVGRKQINLLDQEKTIDLICNLRPQIIIHTAAKVGGIKYNIDKSYLMLFENLILDLNVIKAANECSVEKLIYFSSSCVYPLKSKQPFLVDSILKGEFEPTNQFYAIAKSSMSVLLREMDLKEIGHFKTLVLSNLYGKYDNFDIEKGHVLAAAFTKILNAKRNNKSEIEIWGSGTPRREFTLAKDVASFVLNSLQSIQDFPPIMNLGCGKDYSIQEIYHTIGELLNYKGTFNYNTSMPDGVNTKLMNSEEAFQKFNWCPEKDLRLGILSELVQNLEIIN